MLKVYYRQDLALPELATKSITEMLSLSMPVFKHSDFQPRVHPGIP